MKIIRILFIPILFVALSCEEGYIDDISAVSPGPDETAPDVTIMYPNEGTEIQVYESVTSINIEFQVEDDIEIENISVKLNGTEIASYSEFLDYRKFIEEFTYDELETGDHVLEVTATDIDGKSTTESVNFAKVPPYTPKYANEVFYMPFNGDYVELISVTFPDEVGNPGFAGSGKVGSNAYAGAEGSYLTFPADELENDELTAVFWMQVTDDPARAGVLVVGPVDEANPDAQNNRTSGFRFFRENVNGKQRFKLNVGTGASDSWFDGGAAADVTPNTGEWVHFAFTITQSHATVYINGEIVTENDFAGIDWTGTDILSIMSGAPRFSGWDHLSDYGYMDELRIFDKALTQNEIQGIIVDEGGTVGPQPEFGEIFYMPFDGTFAEAYSNVNATEVGDVQFAGEGLRGDNSMTATADSYLTFPSGSLENEEISASFWYKLNADPARAGILVIGPPDEANPDAQNLRTSGFRLFREDAGEDMRFKLNVGTGDSEEWFDGGEAADIPSTTDEWVHIAFTISQTEGKLYINGEIVSEKAFDGIDWANTDIMSIGSGAPRFAEWGHLSDLSYIDELRIFDRVISQTEVQAIMAAE